MQTGPLCPVFCWDEQPNPIRQERILISPTDYTRFRDFLQRACGIQLGDNKQYLVQSRLRRILAEEQLETLGTLVDRLERSPRATLREQVVDAMTTNETLWFRDSYPFTILEQRILPELAASNGIAPLRFWSAASSSGQEAYSISMTIHEYRRRHPGKLGNSVTIIGTDISQTVLEMARKGEYEMLALNRGLTEERLRAHFQPTGSGQHAIRAELKKGIEFRYLNLLDSYSGLGKFDVVFCRNVLIYFSAELKKDILQRIHAALKPGGYLILGASESLNGLPELYEMIHCSPGIIYRRKPD